MPIEINLELSSLSILWWLFIVIVLVLFKLCIGYRRLNTFTLFLPLLILTNGIFVPFSYRLNEEITRFKITTFDSYWLSLTLMYLVMLIGILLANLFKRRNRPSLVNIEEPDRVGNLFKTELYICFVFTISIISLIQIYYHGLGFDLYSYFTGKMTYADYSAHRYQFSALTKGWEFYLYNKLPYAIAPLSIIIIWNIKGVSIWIKLTFMAVLSFSLIQTGHKMPFVMVLLYILIPQSAMKRKLVLSKQVLFMSAGIFVLSILAIIPLFYIMQGERTYASALYWSFERIFFESERTLQLYFEVYPMYHDYLYGSSTRTVATLLGVPDYISPSVYIPQQVLGLINTSFPALFIGEAWADFGYIGVITVSLLVGFILQLYNIWYFNKKKHYLEDTALFLSIALGSIHLLNSNFLTALLNYGLFTNLIIYRLIKRPRTSYKAAIMPNLI